MGHSGSGSNVNEGVLRISQSSFMTGTSPSDCLVSYRGHSLVGVLPLCKGTIGVFYSPSQLGNVFLFGQSVPVKDYRADLEKLEQDHTLCCSGHVIHCYKFIVFYLIRHANRLDLSRLPTTELLDPGLLLDILLKIWNFLRLPNLN